MYRYSGTVDISLEYLSLEHNRALNIPENKEVLALIAR